MPIIWRQIPQGRTQEEMPFSAYNNRKEQENRKRKDMEAKTNQDAENQHTQQNWLKKEKSVLKSQLC